MPVLLFDIDGTLVRTGGSGKVAMELALRTAFGVAENACGYPETTSPAGLDATGGSAVPGVGTLAFARFKGIRLFDRCDNGPPGFPHAPE